MAGNKKEYLITQRNAKFRIIFDDNTEILIKTQN